MYPPRRKTPTDRIREGEAHRARLAIREAIEAENTRFKGPEPIGEAVVAYGAGMHTVFQRMRGDAVYSSDQTRALLEDAMCNIRKEFTERQREYHRYEPTVVIMTDGKRDYFSLRLDGWEIMRIS
jgi:hypothetical protein